jgi:hypothetical protein
LISKFIALFTLAQKKKREIIFNGKKKEFAFIFYNFREENIAIGTLIVFINK